MLMGNRFLLRGMLFFIVAYVVMSTSYGLSGKVNTNQIFRIILLFIPVLFFSLISHKILLPKLLLKKILKFHFQGREFFVPFKFALPIVLSWGLAIVMVRPIQVFTSEWKQYFFENLIGSS